MKRKKEYWIPCCGWILSHEISNWGRIRSVSRMFLKKDGKLNHYKGKILKQFKSGGGYLTVGLNYQSKKLTKQVNILMLQSFKDPDYLKRGLVGNHKDGNKENNYIDNLEITTHSGNMRHAHQTGLNKNIGQTHYSAKLSDKDVIAIRNKFRKGTMQKDLAVEYNIHKNYVGEICRQEKRKITNLNH